MKNETQPKTAKNRMYQQIQQHGENLNAIFNTGIAPVTLCKKLRRVEAKAHKLATDYCNGENGVDSENWGTKCAPILASVRKILFPGGVPTKQPLAQIGWSIYVNGDARGYALKIKDDVVRANNLKIYTDWGGYGILAPDFSNL